MSASRATVWALIVDTLWGCALAAQTPLDPLSREREMALALSAAPPHVAATATVYVLEHAGYVLARSGKNGFTCLVLREHPEELAPVCYDREGTRTIVPRVIHEAGLRAQGRTEEEVRREIALGLLGGRFLSAGRVGIAYMLSPQARAVDPRTGRVADLPPHVLW